MANERKTPQRVAVKAFGGEILRRWMIGVVGDTAIITDDDGAAAFAEGREPSRVVGFRLCDVLDADGVTAVRAQTPAC